VLVRGKKIDSRRIYLGGLNQYSCNMWNGAITMHGIEGNCTVLAPWANSDHLGDVLGNETHLEETPASFAATPW
jgi:hypothetical protein